jgi:hypothetical protein
VHTKTIRPTDRAPSMATNIKAMAGLAIMLGVKRSASKQARVFIVEHIVPGPETAHHSSYSTST